MFMDDILFGGEIVKLILLFVDVLGVMVVVEGVEMVV